MTGGREERCFFFFFWRRTNTVPWGVSMCSLLIYVLNSRRKRNWVGFGGDHLLAVEVRFAVVFVSVSGFWGGGPWSNWRRRCSRCPLGTGSETCCSGTGRATTGMNAAACSVYARRTESVAHQYNIRTLYHCLESTHFFCTAIKSLWSQQIRCMNVSENFMVSFAVLFKGRCCNRFSRLPVCAEATGDNTVKTIQAIWKHRRKHILKDTLILSCCFFYSFRARGAFVQIYTYKVLQNNPLIEFKWEELKNSYSKECLHWAIPFLCIP